MPPKKATERPGVNWSKIVLNLALPVGGVLVALLVGGISLHEAMQSPA